jgi:hypothetical protein
MLNAQALKMGAIQHSAFSIQHCFGAHLILGRRRNAKPDVSGPSMEDE